eukprot:326447-Lingulodinium_polyedra.AAC.1
MLPGTCSDCWLVAPLALLTDGTDVPGNSLTDVASATAPSASCFGGRPLPSSMAVRGAGGAG